jgi:molybdopterin-binding protein
MTGLLSHANQLHTKIISVNNGQILSSIHLEVEGFVLESIITLEASLKMRLSKEDHVLILLKESDIFLC